MKRSPMRRARKNRRRHQNAELYEQYKLVNDHCEISYWLGAIIHKGKLVVEHAGFLTSGNLQRHHIWSLGRRPDYWSNIITVHCHMHDYFHQHLPESRVMSVLAKLRKMEKTRQEEPFFHEVSIDELNKASGKLALGVIDNYRFPFEEVQMKLWQEECVQRLTELAKGGAE